MGRAHESITDQMQAFCDRQHVFFVATAPSEGGHVNASVRGAAEVDDTTARVRLTLHIEAGHRLTFADLDITGGNSGSPTLNAAGLAILLVTRLILPRSPRWVFKVARIANPVCRAASYPYC